MSKKSSAGQQLIVDGVRFPPETAMFHAQLALFRYAPKLQADPYWRPSGTPSEFPYTGQGSFSHARVLAELLQLKVEWHDFSEKAMRSFCENRETAICGGGGTSKSTTAGLYALLFLMCGVHESAVLIASTSIDAARKRIWKNVSEFYSDACRITGGLDKTVMLGNPKPHIRSSPKDMAHGVYVIPVAQGDVQKAINEIKGFHPRRLLVIGDETDSISQAIVDVCANLQIGSEKFQAIWLGNLPSAFNPLGRLMEPAPGIPVSEACGTEWTSSTGVHCHRFDGADSPNIRDNNKWTGLVRQSDIDEIVRKWGANSLHYWTMVKGLPAPQGVANTVVSESILAKFNCYAPVTWQRDVITSVLLDPAFGGDRCTLRKIQRGKDIEGNLRVLYHPPIVIPINVGDATNPAEFQIANYVISFCKSNNVPPDEFILDATGTGRGVAAVIQRDWSPNIQVCEFGGAPSEMVVSDEDPRPAKEKYDRRVTELYFSLREFVQADMIRGLDPETARELCQREFAIKAKKESIATKTELKSQGFPSPDLADNAILGPELLRRKGINATIQTPAKSQSNTALDRELRENDFDSRDDAYSDEVGVEEAAFF